MTDTEIMGRVLQDLISIYTEHSSVTDISDVFKQERFNTSVQEGRDFGQRMAGDVDLHLILETSVSVAEGPSQALKVMGPDYVDAAMAGMVTSGILIGMHFQRRRSSTGGRE